MESCESPAASADDNNTGCDESLLPLDSSAGAMIAPWETPPGVDRLCVSEPFVSGLNGLQLRPLGDLTHTGKVRPHSQR